MLIENYNFEGPYQSTSNLRDNAGVYVILDHINNQYFLVDVGESSEVKSRVDNHDRSDCWEKIEKEHYMLLCYTLQGKDKQIAGLSKRK